MLKTLNTNLIDVCKVLTIDKMVAVVEDEGPGANDEAPRAKDEAPGARVVATAANGKIRSRFARDGPTYAGVILVAAFEVATIDVDTDVFAVVATLVEQGTEHKGMWI
jgi:3D (Asp-Asp-Asp) domain-containing protein